MKIFLVKMFVIGYLRMDLLMMRRFSLKLYLGLVFVNNLKIFCETVFFKKIFKVGMKIFLVKMLMIGYLLMM